MESERGPCLSGLRSPRPSTLVGEQALTNVCQGAEAQTAVRSAVLMGVGAAPLGACGRDRVRVCEASYQEPYARFRISSLKPSCEDFVFLIYCTLYFEGF